MQAIHRFVITTTLAVIGSSSAFAFFPPVTAPISRPVTITRDPTVDPIKDPVKNPVVCPPVDPYVKPQPKPRPKPEHCGCSTPVGAQSAPEPATLISTGVGLVIAGVAGWTKRRKQK